MPTIVLGAKLNSIIHLIQKRTFHLNFLPESVSFPESIKAHNKTKNTSHGDRGKTQKY